MRWTDRAFILSIAPLNERDLLTNLLTEAHGCLRTVAKFGATSKQRALYQPGNLISIEWNARLPTHMGYIRAEPIHNYVSLVVNDPPRLLMLQSAYALCQQYLYEHDPAPSVFAALLECHENIASTLEQAGKHYALFEQVLLTACGYGLDLMTCAATGQTEDLIYISPKTGRAVSRQAGLPYHGKLFPLPRFYQDGEHQPTLGEIVEAIEVNGYFMQQRLSDERNVTLPPVRHRLEEMLKRYAVQSSKQ